MITLALWIVALYVLAQVAWHALLLVVVLVDRCQRPPNAPRGGLTPKAIRITVRPS